MPVITHMEKTAAADSRMALYEALVKMGIASSFDNATPEQIDGLILAVIHAYRASMQRQSNAGEIPV